MGSRRRRHEGLRGRGRVRGDPRPPRSGGGADFRLCRHSRVQRCARCRPALVPSRIVVRRGAARAVVLRRGSAIRLGCRQKRAGDGEGLRLHPSRRRLSRRAHPVRCDPALARWRWRRCRRPPPAHRAGTDAVLHDAGGGRGSVVLFSLRKAWIRSGVSARARHCVRDAQRVGRRSAKR